jgi:hypothetical protein
MEKRIDAEFFAVAGGALLAKGKLIDLCMKRRPIVKNETGKEQCEGNTGTCVAVQNGTRVLQVPIVVIECTNDSPNTC